MGMIAGGDTNTRRAGLCFLAAAGPLLLLSLVVDHALARFGFMLVVMLFPVALIGIGLKASAPRAWSFLAGLAVLLVGTGTGLLLLPVTGPVILGLPASAILMLLGLWWLPLILTVWVYAATFGSWTLAADDLERLRRRPESGAPAERHGAGDAPR